MLTVWPGRHVGIFHSADQIAACKAVLCTLGELGQTTFLVFGAPLVPTRQPHYQTESALRSTTSLSIFADFVVQARANAADLLGFASLTYRNHRLVQSRYKRAHNVLESVRKESPAEIVYAARGGNRQQMLPTQPTPVALLQELIERLS